MLEGGLAETPEIAAKLVRCAALADARFAALGAQLRLPFSRGIIGTSTGQTQRSSGTS
jgi:hypothetical protein